MIDRIGSFEVVRELGRGGMGVVYLARDPRLGRDVAIKALPEHLASDPARLERFEREARTLAGLNHPNVAGIHGVEERDGAKYLVLEYVDGETLADRLDRGPLPADEAAEYGAQIAAGVEAAHDAGVIHRDLKPANIKVTPEGVAKVLDFGLARTEEGASSTGGLDSPTLTSPKPQHSPTIEGAILGTAAYMSPEQARGRRVDKRTDVWSFGVVLYEMLVGASPFHGETATDSIGAVLHKDLDLERLPPETPAHVRRVLARCLVRDRSLRYRDIGDVRVELLSGGADPRDPAGGGEPARRSSPAVVALAALCVALVAVAIALLLSRPTPDRASPVRLAIQPPPDASLRLSGDLSGPAVVSRDGARVAFAAVRDRGTRRLWLRELSEPRSRELDGTDGAMFPFWSPDGRYIGFFTSTALHRYDTVSDTVERVCEAAQGRGASWTEDGRIVFAPAFRGGLVVVDAEGGEPAPLTTLDDELHTSHRWPFVIPGTDRFLYIAVTNRKGEQRHNAIYLARLDGAAEPTRIMRSDFGASAAGGRLLFVRDGALLARPFDDRTGRFTGDSQLIARDIYPDQSTWHAQVSVSDAGVLVYGARPAVIADAGEVARGAYSWDLEGDRVSAFDYDGRELTAYAVGSPVRGMSLSPDGTTIAYETVGEDEFIDIWLHPTVYVRDRDAGPDAELVRRAILEAEPRRLTSLPGAEVAPTWSPDGSEIAFRWDGDESRPRGIYRKRIGGGRAELVRGGDGAADDYPQDWTADGRHLVVVSGALLINDSNDISAIPLSGGDPIPLVTDPGADVSPRVSPDGRWLAYGRVEGGQWEVLVVPFAPAWPEDMRDRRWVVSQGSGLMPRWSPEGDELYYIDEDATLLAVDVETGGDSFVFSAARALFRSPWDIGRTYDPSPAPAGGDNQFVFVDSGGENETPIAVVLNWPSLLGRD